MTNKRVTAAETTYWAAIDARNVAMNTYGVAKQVANAAEDDFSEATFAVDEAYEAWVDSSSQSVTPP